ncbi:hypothetical protein KH5H1_78590 [Corallococcus caeni]|uniref:hypothetical protein n=1 Tax=Corallococcus caeni TaxID=3082388 RepID=UPI00295720A3|nr:hypothetical protein KH5H1_78590 [Corallococcus sp. KH5-1]
MHSNLRLWILFCLLTGLAGPSANAQLLPPPKADAIDPGGPESLSDGNKKPNSGYRYFLPIKTRQEAASFYDTDQLSTLRNIVVSGWSDRGSIYAEVLADRLGVLRVSLGSTIAAGKEDPSNAPDGGETINNTGTTGNTKDLQRFFGGGGNAVLSAALPLVFAKLGSGQSDHLILYALPKAAIDTPYIGTDSNQFAINSDLGVEIHGSYGSEKSVFSFFGQARAGWVVGNRTFSDNGFGRQGFWFGQWIAGVSIRDTIRFSFQGVLLGPKAIRNQFGPVTLAVSMVNSK